MFPRKRILCIDDADTCEYLAILLEQEGYEVVLAHTAARCLELSAGGRFDLIILETKLDDGDGFELARRLRETDSATPIIFHTASAYPRDIRQGMQAGAQAYVTKPSDTRKLLKLVKEQCGG